MFILQNSFLYCLQFAVVVIAGYRGCYVNVDDVWRRVLDKKTINMYVYFVCAAQPMVLGVAVYLYAQQLFVGRAEEEICITTVPYEVHTEN